MNFIDKIIISLDDAGVSYKVASVFIDALLKNDLRVDKALKSVEDKVDEKIFVKLKNAISTENIEKTTSKLEKYQINAISICDNEYPEKLKNISNPPLVLYYKGNKELLNLNSIAIVGTRKPTEYGRDVARYFSKGLSEAGLVTVSGLAYGLDMEVAEATLNAKGKTIAVLGGGLDKIYPSQNTFLSERIIKSGGLLISLYPPLRRPTKYSFVDRNRIISGLSLGTIIVEAGENSGTLNTASHTIEQGRELFVVPSDIFSKSFSGSLNLISQFPETFTVSVEKVLERLNIKPIKTQEKPKEKEANGEIEKLILNTLYEKDYDFDTLKEKTNLESKLLIRKLTTLEISGLIKKLPNNVYSLMVR